MLVLMNSVVATPRSHGFRLLIKVVLRVWTRLCIVVVRFEINLNRIPETYDGTDIATTNYIHFI